MAGSNFKAIFDNVKKAETGSTKKAAARKTVAPKTAKKRAAHPESSPAIVTQEKKLAKSKDKENYVQGNFYIRKDTYAQVKIKLLSEHGGKELSDLAEELLTEWLAK